MIYNQHLLLNKNGHVERDHFYLVANASIIIAHQFFVLIQI